MILIYHFRNIWKTTIYLFKRSNHQTFKPSNVQTIKRSNHQTVKPSNSQTIKQSKYQTVKTFPIFIGTSQTIKSVKSMKKIQLE